jgi:hypothetical protein
VKSCETKAAVFQQRVQNIESILLAAVQVGNGKAGSSISALEPMRALRFRASERVPGRCESLL